MAFQRTKLVRQDDDEPLITRIHEIAGTGPVRIGADLRAERQRKGVSLEDTAKRLRIGQEYLQAMEDGRFEDLPGRTYAIGFLRSYAAFLGLDGEGFVERYRAEAGAPHGPTELNFPEPLAPPSLPTGRLVAIALGLAIVVFGGWSVVHERGTPILDRVTEVPADLKSTAEPAAIGADQPVIATAAPTTTAATTAPAVEPAVQAQPTAPAEPAMTAATVESPPAEPVAVEPVPSEPVATKPVADAAIPAEPVAVEPVAVEPAPAEPVAAVEPVVVEPGYVPIVYGGATAGRIVITATRESWVQVRDSDGNTLFTRILKPGDVYHVPDRAGLKLHTGNAGGIVIAVDGTALAPLGGLNEVKRPIALDPARLVAGTALP